MREPLIEKIRRAVCWDDPAGADRMVAVVAACVAFVTLIVLIQEALEGRL